MAETKKANDSLVFSYWELRTVIGVLGMALPFVVSIGAALIFREGMQESISYYYHTGMRDVLVGSLFAIGFFLFSYKGYERADNIAGNLAWVFAVGTALFPTKAREAVDSTARIIGGLHFLFAALFLGTLIYFCFFQFTQTNPKKMPTPRKLMRNKVYKACGAVMSACLLLIAVFFLLPGETKEALQSVRPVFWLETAAILAFGVSWFTKGEAILKDEE